MRYAPGVTQVVPVEEGRGERAFVGFPYLLYRGDAQWVPPLVLGERRRFNPRHNPSLDARWMRRFVAWRDGRPVGRIAAIVDPSFSRRWAPDTGFFGFFESADADATRGLLAAAEAALAHEDVRSCLGPVNLTTNDEVGLQVDGFDRPPMLLTPHQPPRYQDELVQNGYNPCRAYHSYLWTPEAQVSPSAQRVIRQAARSGVRIRSVDDGRWAREVALLHEAYNACFADLWGFVPMSRAEFEERARGFRPFYRAELVLLAESRERVVGFAVALPDVNEALKGLGGRLLPLGWLRLWRGMSRIRSARFLLAGVRPECRGRGLAVRLAHEMDTRARRLGLRSAELSLVQDTNRRVRRVVTAFGGVRVKTFRLYQKDLCGSVCR
jgi:GNAT superfamily N-acetyltransferase